jgi:hypothetical protein
MIKAGNSLILNSDPGNSGKYFYVGNGDHYIQFKGDGSLGIRAWHDEVKEGDVVKQKAHGVIINTHPGDNGNYFRVTAKSGDGIRFWNSSGSEHFRIDAKNFILNALTTKGTGDNQYSEGIYFNSSPAAGQSFFFVGTKNNTINFYKKITDANAKPVKYEETLAIRATNFNLVAGESGKQIKINSNAQTYPLHIGSNFKVQWDGTLEATNVDLSGTITATKFVGPLEGNADTATTAAECTGNAATATKLSSSDGSAKQPVYFKDGKPTAIDYTIEKSVPSDAKFTDTHYTTKLFATSSNGTNHASTANGNTYLRLFDDDTARQSINIVGSNGNSVTSDANGKITVAHPTYTELTGKPAADATPDFGGTFTVSQVKVDSTGHVTEVTDRTITIPNTTAGGSYGLVKNGTNGVVTVSGGIISAVKKATEASKLGSNTLGSANKPIYLSSGTATECAKYANGTQVTLNGASKAAAQTEFYAPTGASNLTKGRFLYSDGNGASPKWSTAITLGTYKDSDNNTQLLTSSLILNGTTNKIENADAIDSVVMGNSTQARANQVVLGHYNLYAEAGSSAGTTGTALIIGNGTSASRGNVFKVTYAGAVSSDGAYSGNGADYAEYFEWQDGNLSNEDRRGYFVTLEGKYIKIAKPGDYVLGIISANPSVIGNGDIGWKGRYIRDKFGSNINENFEYEEEVEKEIIDEETNEVVIKKEIIVKTGTKWKENPNYDPSLEYVERKDRSEWDAVGMLGMLAVRDDGTCRVNGYCKVADGGIATAATERTLDTYRVIERVADDVVNVIFK